MAEKRNFRSFLALIVAGGAIVRLLLVALSIENRDFLVTYRLPDDALYYFAIAQNLKHAFFGPLLSYDGLHPTNGMHPLWVFVVAPAFLLGLGKWTAIYVALALQSLLDSVTIWLIGPTVYAALPDSHEDNRRSIALFSAALYAFNAIVVMRSINGLETTLAALLLVLWFSVGLRVIQNGGRAGWFGIVTGLLLLSRTDTALIIFPAMLWLLSRRATRAVALRGALIALLILVPWFIWNLVNFGTIMQSSGLAVPYFAMKKYDVIYTAVGKVRHLTFDAAKNVLKPWLMAGLGIPLLALALAWRSRRTETVPFAVIVALGCVLLLAIHSIFRGFVRDWYVLMQIPIITVIFGIAAARFAEPHPVSSAGRLRLAIAIIIILVPFALRQSYSTQQLIVGRGVPVVEQLSQGHRIAALNSGYYGYFAKRPGSVVNIDGVVNQDAYEAIRSSKLEAYLLADSVDYVLDLAGDLGGYKGLIDRKLLSDFQFDSSFTVAGIPEELTLYRRKTAMVP